MGTQMLPGTPQAAGGAGVSGAALGGAPQNQTLRQGFEGKSLFGR